MKKRIAFLLAVLAVLAAATAFAAMPRRGAAVFVDGFDEPGTFAENWGNTHDKDFKKVGCKVYFPLYMAGLLSS